MDGLADTRGRMRLKDGMLAVLDDAVDPLIAAEREALLNWIKDMEAAGRLTRAESRDGEHLALSLMARASEVGFMLALDLPRLALETSTVA